MACTNYITTAEAKALLGISGEDTLVETLIEWAQALFDSLTGGSLVSSEKAEFHALSRPDVDRYEQGRVFYLKSYKPTAVASINGQSVGTIDVDYILEGQKLTLKNSAKSPDINGFPQKYRVVYTSGFATVPNDVKLAMKYLVSGLYTARKSQGIASFRQDLLSVNYKDGSILDTILDTEQKNFIQAIISTYRVPTVV